jgi:hypothetical protein
MKNDELAEFEAVVKKTVALKLRSKQATVERFYDQIESLGALGYTHDRLTEIMAKAGLELTVGTFRSILARIKASNK